MALTTRASKRLRLCVALAFLPIAAGVACSSGSQAPVTHVERPAIDNAHMRFLNGTPDASASGGFVSIVARSGQFVGSVPYGQLSAPVDFTAGLVADFTVTSSAWGSALTCATPFAVNAGFFYTVVIAGQPGGIGNQRLQCQVFNENFTSPTAGSPQLLFHHASPAAFLAGQDTLQFGTFTPAQGTFGAPNGPVLSFLAQATFKTVLAGANPATLSTVAGATVNVSFPASGVGGIGFYVAPGSAVPTPTPTPTSAPAPTPEATILPAAASIGWGNPGSLPDPSNAFPVGSSTTFSIYVIDAPSGASPPAPLPFRLVGVID